MSIEKNSSVLLYTIPYRESSLLVYLYSLQYGRINALAKGIRRNDSRGVPLERGYVIEHMLYLKPHRDLQLITDCQIIDFFPGIRGNLEKTAIRDLVFDCIISSIHGSEPNTRLFEMLIDFLSKLEKTDIGGSRLLFIGVKTLFLLAGQLGFYLDFSHCTVCGKSFDETSDAVLTIEDGVVRCRSCAGAFSPTNRLLHSPFPSRLSLSLEALIDIQSAIGTKQEMMTLLGIAVDYCRHHLDIHKKLDSYGFIEHLFSHSEKEMSVDDLGKNTTIFINL